MHETLSLVTLLGVWRRLIIDNVSALGKSNQALVLLAFTMHFSKWENG